MKAAPSISVVIPAFNASRYLQAAVCSVLAQTRAVSQIIVVDDGSSDGTSTIAESLPGVQLLNKTHSGISATRNAGIAQAWGDYIAFLDADDLWMPDKLERQLALLADRPGTLGTFGKMRQFINPELPAEQRARFQADAQLMAGQVAGCLLMEREAFLHVGLFDETLPGGEFIDWVVRARRSGFDLPQVDELVLLRRIHGANTVLTATQSMSSAYLQIIRKKMRSA